MDTSGRKVVRLPAMNQPANSWPEGSQPRSTPPTQPGPIGANGAPPPAADDAIATIIPFRNGHALGGYYTSIGSLIPLVGAIAGPIAIWLGVKGLQRVKADPRVKGTAHAIVAIVLGSIGTLISLSCVGTIILGALSR